ncbi:MBL fold metallo-hydrolase [Actinocrispum wychmicini]|uniref:Ribonuclease BN (tRNA processing enzyme) n=1 Tax=Actinocrispum wychmicini TaxID=1213861 RepID=A0A4R2JWP3_9PSEU|nr:MBL fold metallo-hydrolase [Actinocrispum wychmicini]TCO58575.1 ribonuclease BN (tRNA processing enzyme) [Actinocrispum wychmicini]
MKLTVLGSCGAWPEPGRACSGFLLEHEGFQLVVDLGFGVASRLFEHCPAEALDAVVITHEHPDHCVDLNAVLRARYYAEAPRIPLFCTPGVVQRLSAVEPRPPLAASFDIVDLPGSHEVGPFRLTGVLLPHHVPNAGVRLTTKDATVAYTGDTGPDPALAELGRAADLFIVEATLTTPQDGPRTLMTAREAGRWGARAGAKRLMLSHFWPGSDRAQAVRDAATEFPGAVICAEEGASVAFPAAHQGRETHP